MKKHRKFFFVIAVLILGLAGWRYWSLKTSKTNNMPSKRTAGAASAAKKTPSNPSASASIPHYTPSQIQARNHINAMLYRNPHTPIPVTLLAAAGVDKGQIIKGIQDAENQKPIETYGRVIDQYGDAVVGATVDGNLLLNAGATTSRNEKHTTATNAKGEFEFTGLHGVSLGISITKEGYETNNKGFNGAQGKLAPANRDTYVMWKLQGAEQTIADDKFWGIIPDGRTYTIDFIKSKKIEDASADGDLRITINRPADAKRGQKFDWSFTMEAVDGGIVESHDPYPYEAPQSGYKDKIEITLFATDPKWQSEVQGRIFYIKSRSGQVYGHFQIDVIPVYQNAAVFSIKSLVNPASSRNLEEDGKKTVMAGSPSAKLGMSATNP